MTQLPSIGCLRAFESVAKHCSISKAAAELHLTQSAVSRQIQQLEEFLGVQLFQRVRQRIAITNPGKLYLIEVGRAMADLRDSTSRIMTCGTGSNLLNIAVLPTFATRWMIPRLGRFLVRHNQVTIHFTTRVAPFDFTLEPFDAAIHFGAGQWPGATMHRLLAEETVAVCSPQFQRRHKLRCPADLAATTLLHPSTRREAWPGWFKACGVKLQQPLQGPIFEHFSMMTQAAVHHLGVALLPTLLIEEELAAKQLVALFPPRKDADALYYAVVPEGKPSPLIDQFVRWLVHEAQM